jgi:tripartite-type tricarboxylate transporter receptor subunit TctC
VPCGRACRGPGAHAQDDDPNRSIHVVVPYPAGGIIDIVARTVVEQIGRTLKQSIVMEARPGADSNAGTAAVAHGAPDGYTWLVTGPAVLVNPTLYKDTGWEPLRDFKCVGLVVWNKSVAVVPPSLHVKTMAELVALARSKPGELNFGSPGTGTSNEFTAQEFFQAAGIKLATVGYKGQPPALSDLSKNLVQFGIISLALALPAIKDGTVTPLAVFTDKRLPQIPNVPTIAEAGYPAATYLPWYGIYVPRSDARARGREDQPGDQRGAGDPVRASQARGRRHSRQADAARRARGADEIRLCEADGCGESGRPGRPLAKIVAHAASPSATVCPGAVVASGMRNSRASTWLPRLSLAR